MTSPPTIQTNPLDPVFSGVPVTFPQTGTVNPTWNKWFVDLREKVNVINQTLATLSGGSIDPSTGALAISSGGTGATTVAGAQTNLGILANPMTTAGDIIIGGTGGTPTRLPKSTNGDVLTLVSGVPAWAAGGGGGGGTNTQVYWDDYTAGADQICRRVLSVVTSSSATTGTLTYGINPKNSGKWYFELYCLKQSTSSTTVGGGVCITASVSTTTYLGGDAYGWGSWAVGTNNYTRGTYHNGTLTNTTTVTAPGAGQTMRCAVDITGGNLWLSYWGDTSWIGGGDPVAGTSPTFTFAGGTAIAPACTARGSTVAIAYVFQAALSNAIPSGYTWWPGIVPGV